MQVPPRWLWRDILVMKLRLKEDPREWRKFGVVLVLVFSALGALLWHRHRLGDAAFGAWLGVGGLALIAGLVRPRLLRPIYRGAMTGSFHVGQVVGRVLLFVFFFLVLTPLGLLLRLMGKDLLQLRRDRNRQSYWEPARPDTPLDRLF